MLRIATRTSAAFRAPTAGPMSVALSVVDEAGDDVDLAGWGDPQATAAAGFLQPSLAVVPAAGDTPAYLRLTVAQLDAGAAGRHDVAASIVDSNGQRQQLEPVVVVVELLDGWHSLQSAREAWADAPRRDVVLFDLLQLARDACEAYAPLTPAEDGTPAVVPAGHRQAQLNIARAAWQRVKGGQGDQLGIDGFAVRVYIDDPDTRRLLRPLRIRGGIA